ncbi:uncharacterized protein [Oryza sativa Japonica Group]|uniref:Os04g0393200 protein n=3 Tax=Oryza TaxID=4527 RepID=Q7XRU5_ORYSJ|nr:Os04g0393200 [Oryza sativa Japonica Group]CAE02285.2 OSJNBa0055C08.13 [Oryza sativa Japonica Group]
MSQPTQQQRGFGFSGVGAAAAAAAPSPRGMPMAAGAAGPRRLAVQQKQKQPALVPPPPTQQQTQGFGGVGGAGAAALVVGSSSSARGMAAAAAAEWMAHEDAWRACNRDFATPFASVEDAISRLLPYHVFAEYEEDEIYVEDQPPAKDKSSVQEWDDDHEAEAIRMAEEFEKQVVTFNVAVLKSAAGAARAEERLMVENLLLAYERRQSEHVRALVRQQQLVALQKQQQMMAEQRQQQQQMMAALQQRQQPATIMPAQGHPDAMDLFLDAYAAGEQSAYSWMTAAHAVPQPQSQPRQQQPDA